MKRAETPATPNRVYPNVKVRGENGKTTLLEKTEVLILKVVRSLFIGTPHSSTKVFGGTGKGIQDALEDNNQNIKASPIIRPRAVVSSPDNDEMIGDMNKRLMERPPSLKPQDARSTMPPVSRHNAIEEISQAKAGSAACTKGGTSSSSHNKKGVHEHVTRSPRPTQEPPETHRMHVTRPVTPPPPRPTITRPITQTPKSPISRPVTPLPPRSPISGPITLPPPRSPISRPATPPPPRSPVTRRVTPTLRSPITNAVTPSARSPVTRPVAPPTRPSTRVVTPTAAVAKPVAPTQRSRPVTPTHSSRPVTPIQRLPVKKEKTPGVKVTSVR